MSRSEDGFGLSNVVMKQIIGVILKPLAYLINVTLFYSIFPDCLKLLKVTPIFKKGDKTKVGNYWSIGLVPFISNVI